jgi:hypothetical protein
MQISEQMPQNYQKCFVMTSEGHSGVAKFIKWSTGNYWVHEDGQFDVFEDDDWTPYPTPLRNFVGSGVNFGAQ